MGNDRRFPDRSSCRCGNNFYEPGCCSWRGLPISTGWNNAAAAIVVSSEIASNFPMLDVPGWLENHKLPNAVAVVQAENVTARVSTDCSRLVCPSRHAMM